MRKKIFNLSANTLLETAFPWSIALLLGPALISLGSEKVWGNTREIPGLPIARLALPFIPLNPDVSVPTGTFVGEKVIDLRKMMQNVEGQANSIIHSLRDRYDQAIDQVNTYHSIVSEIEAKLQLGTTPSNPKLIELRNFGLQQLDEIATTISMMDGLAAGFSGNSEQVRVLSFKIEDALHIPGAIDEDHAHLILMSDELLTVREAISQTLQILGANTSRQSEWLSGERVRLANLSSAIDKGKIPTRSQGESPKHPLPVVLPELPPLLGKKASLAHPEKKKDKPQITNKKPPEQLSSKALPFAPIHQEVLKEIAQSSKNETSPLALLPGHKDVNHKVAYKAPPPPPLHPPVSETYEDIDEKDVYETTPPAPIFSSPVSTTQEDPAPEDEYETTLPASVAHVPPAVNKQVDQGPNVKVIPPKDIMPPHSPQASIEPLLPLVSVTSHPLVQPLNEEETAPISSEEQSKSAAALLSYPMVAKGRSPLVQLDSNQDLRAHKWLIISSAKRGLKASPNGLEIVNVIKENEPSNRGEEVKSLLIEMGLEPEKLHVVNAKSEENQTEQVYIFGS